MSFLDKLRGRKSSKELGEALSGLRNERQNIGATIEALKAKLGPALFEASETDVASLQRQIDEAEALLARLTLAEAETFRRYEAAERDELEANLSKTRERALKDRDDLRVAANEYDRQLEALLDTAARMRGLSSSIAEANSVLVASGYDHLRVRTATFNFDISRSSEFGALKNMSPSRSFDTLAERGVL